LITEAYRYRFLACLLVLPAVLATTLSAQSPAGTLQGKVTDAQGKPVVDAQLQLFGNDSTPLASTLTGDGGQYSLAGILGGTFTIGVRKDGFRSETRSLEIERGVTKELNITLDVVGVNNTVIVTASGEAQSLSEASRPTTVISQEEIAHRDAYAFGDLLNTVPGLTVQNQGGPGQYTTISSHGLPVEDTAILFDGLRFRDASNTQGDASSFIESMNIITPDHVEVLSGSGSSLYGTDAVGSVINIVSQEGGSPLHGLLQLEGGGLNTYRGRGSIGGGALRNRFTYNVGASYINVLDGVDGHSPWRSTGGQAAVRYNVTPRLSLSGRFWGTADFLVYGNYPTNVYVPEDNIPATGTVQAIAPSIGTVAAYARGGAADFGNATYLPNVWDPDNNRASNFTAAALILRGAISPKVSWQASYQGVNTTRVYQNGPEGVGYQPAADNFGKYVGTVDTAGARLIALPFSWLTLTGGYEFEQEFYRDHQDNNLPSPDKVIESTHAKQLSNAGFFAVQAQLFAHRLILSGSGRAQTFDVPVPNFEYAGATSNPYVGVPINAPHALTGDASIAYLIQRSSTKLRGHGGNAYRAPALYERFGAGFYNDPLVPNEVIFTPYGNPNLAPDRFNSVDGGIDQYLFHDRIRASATVYYVRLAQLIGFVNALPQPDPFGRFSGYKDTEGGISRSEELSVEARPTNTLSVTGSYTYTNANSDLDTTVPGYHRVFDLPRHKVAVVATKQWGQKLSTTFDLVHYSSYLNSFVGYGRAYQFPGYTVGNLVGSYQVWKRDRPTVQVYSRISNLFNSVHYQDGYRNAGITALAGINYSF
jgi:vitamin B12 transporter